MGEAASNVPDLLRERAAAEPDAPALAVDGGETLTFARWEARSNALGRGLVARGVQGGDRVALMFDGARWTDYAVAYMGVLKAGAVAVPLGPRLSRRELTEVLRHSEPAGIVSPPDLAHGPAGWLESAQGLEEGQSGDSFQVPVEPGQLAEILYTSGTTGRPKGVACTHENVLFHDPPPQGPSGPSERRAQGASERRLTFVHAFPVGTNAGQEVLRFPLRSSGRTAVALPVFDPERLCALVAEHRVRNLQLVPAMAQILLSSAAFERHDVSSVERITLSSAPAPLPVIEALGVAFPTATLWNTYALTEAGTARTLMVVDGTHVGSVGRGVGGTVVRVVGDDGNELAPEETGEVWLGRPGAPMRSYYRDPEATAATFAGEWVRTGDVGYLDPEGYLYLTDRKKDVIITGGSNVASLDVENVLHGHPAVADAAVFGVPHAVLGQDVAAAVVLRSPVGLRQLQSFVRERLPEHKTPHRIFVVDDLPRNASGKLLKRELRDRFADAAGASDDVAADVVPPATETQRRLVSIWEEVLDRDHIGVDDDFFDLGGHSLAATQVVARVKDAFDVEVPVDAVFDYPTVAELAALVEEAGE